MSYDAYANKKPNQVSNYNKSGYARVQYDQLDDSVQGKCNAKTHLIQVYTSRPSEGPRLISEDHSAGVPIMVIVDQPSCCCHCKLNVPHGIVTLEQRCGKHTGALEPGYHCCYCNYKRISAMITKNTIRFNNPVEKCPTKDNVLITVDISINFRIGKDDTEVEDCEKFLYYLGANRLQELLEQECEEKVRMFVRGHHVRNVRDLKSEMAHNILLDLGARFNLLGVYFESVTIMNVIIPTDLRVALSTSTAYDVHLQNQIKFQENTKLKLNNAQNMELLKLKRANMMKLDSLNHQKAMEEITLEQQKITAQTDQQLKIINAHKDQSVKVIKADAIKAQAENRAQTTAKAKMADSQAYGIDRTTMANNSAKNLTTQAQNRLDCAKLTTQALIVEADAEEQQSANFMNKRKQIERVELAKDMTSMVRDNKVIISGKAGEDFLNYFKDTVDAVSLRE